MIRGAAVGFIVLVFAFFGAAGPGVRQELTFSGSGFSSLELELLWAEQLFSASLGGLWGSDGFSRGMVGASLELVPLSLRGGFSLERTGEWGIQVGGGLSGETISLLGGLSFGPDGIQRWDLGATLGVPPFALQAEIASEGTIEAALGVSLSWEALEIGAEATWEEWRLTSLRGSVGLAGALGTASFGAIMDIEANDLYLTTEFDFQSKHLSFGLSATWDPTPGAPLSLSSVHPSSDERSGPWRHLVELVAEASFVVPPPAPGASAEAVIGPLISSPKGAVFVVGEEIRFSARGSLVSAGPAEYRWEFGDGASARGIEARHRYTGPGLYRVVLTVQDRSGNAASAERTIRIVPPELVADFTWSPEEPTVLDEVRFRDLSRGEIEKWNWDFGDGATSDIPNPTHSYKEKGTFTVTLTVTDRYGNSAAASKELRVVNIPPTADPGGPYEGFIYQEIVFSAERSSDPDGEIVSYLWDFGDGNEARGRQVLHVYLKPGTYTVCLTVIDDDGDADTACTTAEIAVYYQTPEGGSP